MIFFYVNVSLHMAENKINKIKFSPVDIEERKKLNFKAGDTVSVSSKILDEKGKFRFQAFEGMKWFLDAPHLPIFYF